MSSVTCVICGARKGAANKWWVLFEAAADQAVLIGPIDDAETLHHWRPASSRFHVCGAQCLYRKLNGVLLRNLRADSAAPVPEEPPSIQPPPALLAKPPKLRETAAIGEGLTIIGQIQSDESLYVNGELNGTLDLHNHRLTVGPNATVRANVQAREVEIFGVVEGEVRAAKIVVRKNARVTGDLCTVSLVIEEGAVFEGTSRKAPAAAGYLRLSASSSSNVRGQSDPSKRERPRSARTLPPV
jgi:cytoskeletal protein CcmA (bactofilin family)